MNSYMSIGEKYGPAMAITEPEEARLYFERCVEHTLRCREVDGDPVTRAQAEAIERANLGYVAGYYSSKTRERVERLFRCAHPVFGSIAENGAPSADEALMAGVRMATAKAKP